jgi:hypothetical protein
MRHRSAPHEDRKSTADDGSSDDDDAFSALSRKRKVESKPLSCGETETKKVAKDRVGDVEAGNSMVTSQKSLAALHDEVSKQLPVVVAQTSSTKRHHGEVSDARKAKMDAILLELESETTNRVSKSSDMSRHRHRSNNLIERPMQQRSGGSFVDPGDEHMTTNIFVGNLAPSITEEQMTELFRQFGENCLSFSLLRCLIDFGVCCTT